MYWDVKNSRFNWAKVLCTSNKYVTQKGKSQL